MKKLTFSILSLIFLLCAAVGLVGCGKETHTHSFTKQKVEQQYLASEATCTESAKYYYSCSCSKKGTETFTYGNALGHSFGDWVIIKEPTETEKGFKTRSCTRYGCNIPENEEIPALAHTHKFTEQNADDKYLVAEATCTNPAQYYYSCICSEKGTETFTYGNALGHSFTNYVSDNNATCTEDGTKTATCDHIGCTENNTIADENSKLGHSFTDYVSDGNATCTQDGTKTAKCDRCNAIDTVTDEGSAKGHSYSSQWEYNDTYHWQNSICGHEIKGNYAMHTPDESGFCTVCDQPIQATEGVVYDVSPSGEYAEVIDYTGTSKRINIADTYNSLPVQSIYNEAFKGKDITYVIIPSSVKNIGVSAFYGCSGLTNITIPDSVTSIGSYAFRWCSGLMSVTIGNGVTSIGDYAFSGCSGLTSITIGNGVTSIGDYAFEWCDSLTSITIPDSVISISSSVFENCKNLKYNKYGNALYLGNPDNPYHALINVVSKNYSSCEIYEKTKVLANNCFAGCIRLTSIVIPDSVTSIGNSAFCNCSGLTSVTIGNGITSMDYWAFYGCSGLTSVTIGNGVIYIGDQAFSGCSELENIYIADIAAWCNISGLSNLMYYGSSNKKLYLNNELVTDLIIPDSVTSIGDSAFYGCSGLTSVTIGSSVIYIDDQAFYDCTKLNIVYYVGSEDQWEEITISTGNDSLKSATIFYKCGDSVTYHFETNCDEQIDDVSKRILFK